MIYLPPSDQLRDWPWADIRRRFSSVHHGDYTRWADALEELPDLSEPSVSYDGHVTVLGSTNKAHLKDVLLKLHPWRKGPYRIAGLTIDTEWRSDWKWARIAPHIELSAHRVLDIGCGNGYFGWRMLQHGAREIVGIDPTLLFCMQHQVLLRYSQDFRNWVLPLKVEELVSTTQFDSVFSMGVLYHRREPLQHLQQIFALTRPQGQAIIETLIHPGAQNLIPAGRYARMRNVWCIPHIDQLKIWMNDAGFVEVDILDVSKTTVQEQRSTPWMTFESLTQALDPQNPELTIEGHPAPIRAVVRGVRR